MIKLRIADKNDAQQLAPIYAYYVENTAISFEYSAPTVEEFESRVLHKLEKYPFIVAAENGRCIGYAYASQFRERESYDWSVELSVYVDKEHLKKGVGTRLYGALLELLALQNFAIAYSLIALPNPSSVALHERFGFVSFGVSRAVGFKNQAWHDVIWYEKKLNYFENEQALPIIPFPNLDKKTVAEILAKH